MGIAVTVILCDHVYQAQGGKYVIAGTYTTIEVHVPDLRLAEHRLDNLAVYVRLRPEQLGTLACELLVRDEQHPPWHEPMLRLRWDAIVTRDNIRLVECAYVQEGGGAAAADGRGALRDRTASGRRSGGWNAPRSALRAGRAPGTLNRRRQALALRLR